MGITRALEGEAAIKDIGLYDGRLYRLCTSVMSIFLKVEGSGAFVPYTVDSF